MLAEDERQAQVRTVEDQATLVAALAAALTGKEGAKRVQDGYRERLRVLRGEPSKAAPPVASVLNDPYLAALGARIARQARRRRMKEARDGR